MKHPILTRSAMAAAIVMAALPAAAQVTGSATVGQTRHASFCASCHGSVTDHRSFIWTGNAYADVPFATAYTDIDLAINSVSAMRPLMSLTVQQRSDIAAYLADTPKVTAVGLNEATSPSSLSFSAAAQGSSVSKTLTINHSVATTDTLRVVSVALDSSSARFTHNGSSCTSSTPNLSPAGSCSFNVSYVATTSSPETRTLTITLIQNGTTFTRSVAMTGSVNGSTTTPPPTTPPATSTDSGGGGAIGWLWQAGLSLGTAVLWWRRRRAQTRPA